MSSWLGEPGPPSPVEEMSFLLFSEHTTAPSAELFILDSGALGVGVRCNAGAHLPSLVLTPLSVMSGGTGPQASCPLLSLFLLRAALL